MADKLPADPAESRASRPEATPWLEELPPRQIVAELDRYIVGQQDAKKAVAIAVRNPSNRRSDRVLRRLEALLAVANEEHSLVVGGDGELIEPDDGILAIGSGGNYALAAARAYLEMGHLDAREIVEKSLLIAGDICLYTNRNLNVVEL